MTILVQIAMVFMIIKKMFHGRISLELVLLLLLVNFVSGFRLEWISGFPTGVANMGGGRGGAPQNLMGVGLSQNIGGAWGKLKMLLKNTCE